MRVASIHSQYENGMVASMVTQPSYLGARESEVNGEFSWDDGSTWDWTNPSNDGMSDQGETRLAFNSGVPQWHDWGTGDALLGVVCRKPCGQSSLVFACLRAALRVPSPVVLLCVQVTSRAQRRE